MIPGPQRHLFDIPDGIAYLNCAYLSPNLRSVRRAGERAVGLKSSPWEIQPADFFSTSEHARSLFARLIGADADGVFKALLYNYATGRSMPADIDEEVFASAFGAKSAVA